MIEPFLAEKTIINGKSAGLSACSYDIRTKDRIELGPNPSEIISKAVLAATNRFDAAQVFTDICVGLREAAPCRALGVSLEHFVIPNSVSGYVCDKSTYARLHVTAFNTLFDPGFEGYATLELVNLGDENIVIEAGDPVCQLVFHWLDEATDRPYRGKFHDQPDRPVGPRFEQIDGSFIEVAPKLLPAR